jgi:hypothetical protein
MVLYCVWDIVVVVHFLIYDFVALKRAVSSALRPPVRRTVAANQPATV